MTDYVGTIANLIAAMDAARRSHDADLTVDANRRRQATERGAAIAAARGVIDPAVESAGFSAERTAGAALSAVTGGAPTTEQLTARRYAWDRVVMLLDAGRTLEEVTAAGDQLTVEAVAEYGPTWVRAQSVRPDPEANPLGAHHFTEPDTAWVTQAVVARLADVAADPAPFAAAVTAANDAARAGLYSDVLAAIESNGGRVPGEVLNRLHRSDPDGYAVVMGATLDGAA